MNGRGGWDVSRRDEQGRTRSRTLRIVAVVAPIVMVLLCVPIAVAAPGDLDPTFGSGGKVTTDVGGFDSAEAVAGQADGKLVVLGQTDTIDAIEPVIARYNVDGSPDPTFSGDGRVTIDFGGERDSANGITLQDDGKIVVAGTSCVLGEGCDFAVARYNPDGSLDTGFSGDGTQTTDFGTGLDTTNDFGYGVALQTDGKIVLAGQIGDPTSTQDFALARYNADGSLDTGFSGDGRQITDFAGHDDSGRAVAVQGDGKIVVAGSTVTVSGEDRDPDFGLARYNADGSLDTGFSDDGRQTADFGGIDDLPSDVAVQDDGRIMVVGGTSIDAGGVFALARFDSTGSPDTSFSDDGKVTTAFGDASDFAEGVALQDDGKLVVAGTKSGSSASPGTDFALARYDSSGALDGGFSADGKVLTDFAGESDGAAGVALQSDGKIVAAGYTVSGESTDFALARYEGGDGPGDTTPPETTITSGPAGTTADPTPTFEFSSSETGSSFECRVDSAAFAPCSSPHATAALANGSHTFEVRAIDQADNVDPTPASRAFTVAVSPPPPTDSDGDGVPDGSDACPSVAGSSATGCPPSGGSGSGSSGTPSTGGGGGTPAGEPPSGDGDGDVSEVDTPSLGGSKSAGAAKVSPKGALTVPKQSLDCTGTGPDCAVTTTVTGSVPASRAGASAKRRKAKTVKLGGSSFKVKAGKKGKVTVKLTRKGLKLLKRLKRINAKVTITVRRGSTRTKKVVTVTLKAPKPPARRKRA